MVSSMISGILHSTDYLIKIFPALSEDALIQLFIKHLLYCDSNVPLGSRFLFLTSCGKIDLML